jgi:peptidase M1-like protein
VRLLAVLLFPVLVHASGNATDVARGVREIELDPAECYRVHDVQINKDDVHLYFTDGYLIFGKPVGDTPIAAVFTADVEAGDAELLLLPPNRSERRSLASYTGSPNLEEHFAAAVLLFGDDTYRQLMDRIRANEFNRRRPEIGPIMAEQWNSVVRNLASSFEARLLLDLLSPRHRRQGSFVAAISGKTLGNFDVVYEPRSPEQVIVGQVAARNDRTFFDVWTSFEAEPERKGKRPPAGLEFAVKEYRIEATIEPNLFMHVVTKVRLVPAESGELVLPFDITSRMQISSATIDGQPAEVLEPASLRSNLIRNTGNDLFLVVAPKPLDAGREYEVEIRHEGAVIDDAGNQVYYVGSRATWYPNLGMQFGRFDLTFRYPKDLDLVTAGEVVSDRTEGEWRTTRRVTAVPIRIAGFNLGFYQRARVIRDGYTVEVCANRAVEAALKPKASTVVVAPHAPLGRRPEIMRVPPGPAPSPAARIEELADEVASAISFMTARFGPPPLKTLEVSPIPGAFGQGFPGLLYVSTMSYLRRQDQALASLDKSQQSFFSDLLDVHETAHQWWGNVVSSNGYHDEWLMEALASYSALLYLEKRDGRRSTDAILEGYRKEMLTKNANNETLESAGPIVLGARLENSQAPASWHSIIYGKGPWIIHMLRARMGDERFLAMLGELRRRYEWKQISTEQFRQLAAEFLPPKSRDAKLEAFFDQWVYGTGIPSLKLSYSVRGRSPAVKLTGTISQSDVDSEFSAEAPVEIQVGRDKMVKWVRTSSSPVEFTAALRQAPTRVALDYSSILAVRK